MPFQKGDNWNGNPNGRPKNKTFRDYFNDEEIADLIEHIKQNYKSKPDLLKLVAEQIFGKPKQVIEGSDSGTPILIKIIRDAGNNDQAPQISG